MIKESNKYRIDLEVDVENRFLSANVVLDYYCKTPLLNELNLYIHKDLNIQNIYCDKKSTYLVEEETSNWCPFILESKLIKVIFDELINIGESINLHMQYEGHIGLVTEYGINRISKGWIELGIYTPWFPITEGLEEAMFNVNIKIDKGYKVINSKEVGDYFILNQAHPSADCTVIASNGFYILKEKIGNIDINVYITKTRFRSLAESIAKYSSLILKQYANFGEIHGKQLSIVIAPRDNSGGYCRPNLIVLTPEDDLEDEIRYFRYIAHELAHLWWCKSVDVNSWEDWLNESFAEYSALLALRHHFGEIEFNTVTDKYKEKSKELPPIMEIDRSHEKANQVLYIKGPLLLYELEKIMGRGQFIELLKITHVGHIDSTDKFLERLGEFTNQEIKEHFKKSLSI